MMTTCSINNNQALWLLTDTGMDQFLDYAEQEELKHKYGQVLQAFKNGEASMDELFIASEGRSVAWFFRSVANLRLPLLHPQFPAFISMLLNEEHISWLFPAEIVERMVAKYGQRKGEINGSYWIPVSKRIKGNLKDVLFVKGEKIAV